MQIFFYCSILLGTFHRCNIPENRKTENLKALGHVKEACFDSYDVFNMNIYLEFCG